LVDYSDTFSQWIKCGVGHVNLSG